MYSYYALCAAAAFFKGDYTVTVPDRRPDDRSIEQLVECMRLGNNLYDERHPCGGPLLGIYDGLDLVSSLGV